MLVATVRNAGTSESRALALAYLAFGLVAILLFARLMPPYQNPDEVAHFKRVDHISRGSIVGQVYETTSGGIASPLIEVTSKTFSPLSFHPEVKLTAAMRLVADPVKWSDMAAGPAAFPNTAGYPPVLYLPAAIAVFVGRMADMSVVRTLIAARMANGLASVLIGSLAILVAGAAAPFLLVILSLPMTLSLMASAAHDGPMIALSALAVGLVVRARERNECRLATLAAVTVAIVLVATARPPYAVLAVLPLMITGQPLRRRVLAASAIVLCTLLWSLLVLPINRFTLGPGANVAAQLQFLREHVADWTAIVARTFQEDGAAVVQQFVGRLGWLDTELPASYHLFAWVVLAVSALATIVRLNTGPRLGATGLTIAAVLIGGFSFLPIQYLIWSPVGYPYVVPIQGRYFLPLALAIAAVLPAFGAHAAGSLMRPALFLIRLFMIITLPVSVHALVIRYYLA